MAGLTALFTAAGWVVGCVRDLKIHTTQVSAGTFGGCQFGTRRFAYLRAGEAVASALRRVARMTIMDALVAVTRLAPKCHAFTAGRRAISTASAQRNPWL